MTPAERALRPGVAICVHGLGDNWLGGVNYYRNLLRVFDEAQDQTMRLHVLTDDAGFLDGERFSDRVAVHEIPAMRPNTPAWALRKALQLASGRDVVLLRHLTALNVRAVVFGFVQGARESGMTCLPWVPDFQSQQLPEMFPPGLAEAEARRTRRWLRRASGLVLSSRTARADAVRFFNADPERLHVLRFAPHIEVAAIGGPQEREALLRRHAIREPYFFLPNQYWKHKNHVQVAQALAHLRARGAKVPLVVSTGRPLDSRDPGHFPAFENFLRQEGLEDRYRVLGVVPRNEMMTLLAYSRAVVNPSRFEGWSTTVEEAKALGKPLLLSDIPVHREQTEGRPNAWRFALDDAEALARLLCNPALPSTVDACMPQPDRSLHQTFQAEYLALLHRLLQKRDLRLEEA